MHRDAFGDIVELRLFKDVKEAAEIMKAIRTLYPSDLDNITLIQKEVE